MKSVPIVSCVPRLPDGEHDEADVESVKGNSVKALTAAQLQRHVGCEGAEDSGRDEPAPVD